MTDKELFEASLVSLRKHVEEDYHASSDAYIIALSRKGPRLLECLFGNELGQYRVVTEYALPFLFKQLANHPNIQYNILVVDDAVYFGSTLYGVYEEILYYKKYYKLNLEIKAYTAVKSQEAIDCSFNIVCDYTVPSGFSHFFAKNVMSVIRGLHTSMEVDFPRICYTLKEHVDIDKLYEKLEENYPGCVYRVESKENFSINILLKPVFGSFFNKIRIFVDGCNVHIITMTPRIISDSDERLGQLFVNANEMLDAFWTELFHQYIEPINEYEPAIARSVKKVLVALANYIYSFNTYIGERSILEHLLLDSVGEIKEMSLRYDDLKYLLGADLLCERFNDLLSGFLIDRLNSLIEYRVNLAKFSNKEVFESLNFPEKEERDTLLLHNMHMIRNSRSQSQALSAVFFNQTLLVERWSRKKEWCNAERLRFGYTFQSIQYLLGKFAQYEQETDDTIKLHKWIDKRIDLGCIVPQYIIDGSNGIWTRVFRPGENEDVVLSHLARWVLSVYNYLKDQIDGQVNKQYLYNFLAYLIYKVKSIGQELGLPFTIKKRGTRYDLMLTDESGVMVDVLDYMERMYILTEKEDNYVISGLLQDNDIKEYTTLPEEVLNQQRVVIDEVIREMKDARVPQGLWFLVFNYFFRDMLDVVDFKREIRKCCGTVLKCLDELEPQIRMKSADVGISNETARRLMFDFTGLYPYLMLLQYMFGSYLPASNKKNDQTLLELQKNAYRLNLIITVIQQVYFTKDISRMSPNIKNSPYYYEYIDAGKIRELEVEMMDKGSLNEAYTNRSLIFALRGLITNHILND